MTGTHSQTSQKETNQFNHLAYLSKQLNDPTFAKEILVALQGKGFFVKANLILTAAILLFQFSAQADDKFELALRGIENLQAEEAKTITESKHTTQIYSHGKKTKYVLLSLPGLHESPFHLQGLNNFFYNEGANVVSLHLPGHHQKDENAIHEVTAKEWSEAVNNAINMAKELGDELMILGYSTGGGLAIQAALQRPEDIKQLYLFAPSMALSNKVFLFTLFGQVVSKKKLCNLEKPGVLCKVFDKLDPQSIQMIKEGTYPSAKAGTQVQALISNIAGQFGNPNHPSEETNNYYKELEEIYSSLKIPTFLVSSMADTITAPKLNRAVYDRLTVRKEIVEYPKSMGITHLMISKSKGDAFVHTPDTSYNPHFDELTQKMKTFWKAEK